MVGFLRYDGLSLDERPSSSEHEAVVDHLVRAGVRLAFGGPGAIPFSLPRFGHWVIGATVVD